MRRVALLLASLLPLSLVSACGGGNKGAELIVYNAQHEQLISKVAKAFEQKTGIDVRLRNGDDLELANQIVAEGKASPADVFLTENSPAMRVVDAKNLLVRLDDATLAQVPAQFHPGSGHWTGFAARSTALVYNTAKVKPGELPTSILDLADAKWKGRVTFSPTGADFQAIVAAVLALKGETATKHWLEGLKANGTFVSSNNLVVLKAVNDGKADIGIFYHYYWYRDQAEGADNSAHTKLLILSHRDPGAFLSTSGAGVLKAGAHQSSAQKFVAFLSSVEGQRVIAASYAREYTLNPQVDLGKGVTPLRDLQPPFVSPDDLNSTAVITLLQEVGLL
jgi:iron(III) transport system substrate-binding protein